MEDVQNHTPSVPMHIDRVGCRGMKLPMLVRDREKGIQQTIATIDVGVDLPSSFKGTHMSRFVEALREWNEDVSYASLKRLLVDVKRRLGAQRAWTRFSFPYFMAKAAPATCSSAQMSYDCRLTGELDENGKQNFLLEIWVPVMTVCPCSKAISREGAHSQRALVYISVRMNAFVWLEDFIEIAERSGSSPVYTLLKREDEKYVTEHAFSEPVFVEDVVRNVAQQLARHEHITWFSVEVESMESIHNHSAFARIEQDLEKGVEQKSELVQCV